MAWAGELPGEARTIFRNLELALDLEPGVFDANPRFIEDLGFDSLQMFSLLLLVEDSCGVTIDDDEFDSVVVPADLLRFMSAGPGA